MTDTKKVTIKRNWKRIIMLYIMMLPGLAYLLINNYIPMFGVVIAFKKLNFRDGILGSPWSGFDNFKFLFSSSDAWIIIRNTIGYNIVGIILGIVFGLLLAIMLNEITNKLSQKFYQSMILLPYLMSWVIVSYLTFAFLSADSGLINNLLKSMGINPIAWYNEPKYWPFILVFANIWKSIGYGMIVYYASLVGISMEYYEAARLDGASKWQQIKDITLPLMKPTVITMMILNIGNIFRSDFGLFYQLPRNSGALYDVTRTLDVYVYNALMRNNDFGMSSAASFIQSVVGLVLIVAANWLVRKYNEENALF